MLLDRSIRIVTRALLCCSALQGVAIDGPQAESVPAAHKRSSWQVLTPCFQPPPEFRNQLGSYRSPLEFEDGTIVKTPADWARRRKEILNEWHALMGPWPPVIERPNLEFLSKSQRDD